jgi:hypothetical protein
MNSFKRWLPEVLPKIFDDRDVQLELGRRLESIDPRIRWEAGPHGQDSFLAFSPNFNNDLLPLTEELAMTMPAVQGWHFFGAKPRKRWSVRKILFKGVEYFFDEWRYRLVMFKGGEFFDIDFFTFGEAIDEGDRAGLGVFLACSELGEKLFMRAVDRVNIGVAPQPGESTISIESLFEQISDLYSGELPSE